MLAVGAPLTVPVGQIISLGPFCLKYEVGQAIRHLDDGDWMIEVTLVETGEKEEYRWALMSNALENQRAALAAAHERYMYFSGVYTDKPRVDRIAEDRPTFSHLLMFTADGRPSLSDQRCAEFMAAITGLPREWCLAWDEFEFVNEHGDGFFEKQLRRQESMRLAATIKVIEP